MIKPIETVYKGYRFRSRLEARWAVFFDALGLNWKYESEGFDVDGEYYLPDFFVEVDKDYGWIIVEIKHNEYKPTEKEKRLWSKIDKESLRIESPDGNGFAGFWIMSGTPEVEKSFFDDVHWMNDGNTGIFGGSKMVFDACTKARQARFEHGETP